MADRGGLARTTKAKRVSPDADLAVENYHSLNDTFYTSAPADYFERRLFNLILVAGNREGVDRLIAEGTTFKELRIGEAAAHAGPTSETGGKQSAPEPTADLEAARKKAADHFVIAEAEVLAQHVGETLLRLYLAHECGDDQPPPPSPWLEVSRLRVPSQFKQRVERRFGAGVDIDDPANLRAVARVFHGVASIDALKPPVDEERWNKSLRTIEGYLRHFAGEFLTCASLYNAAKHGLAVTPMESSKMTLGDGKLISAEGPAINYLDIRDRDGQPRWHRVSHWVRPDRQMALIYRACELIDTLWMVARYRYLPATRTNGFRGKLFTGAALEDIRISKEDMERPVVIEEMSMELGYYLPEEEGTAGTGAPSGEESTTG